MPSLDKTTKLKLIVPVVYLLAANALFIFTFDSNRLQHQIPGLIIANVAFILWLTARIQLGNAFSIAPKSKFLVKTGLYSKFRHPVYYFSIIAVMGISVFIWSPYTLSVVVLLIMLELFRIHKEELLLQQTFGKEYISYKQQTWL